MKTLIVTDTSCTITNDLKQKYDVDFLPLVLIRNDHKEYVQEVFDLKNEQIMQDINNNYTFTTSCTPLGYSIEFIKQKLQEYDRIIILPISKGWSSQYEHLKNLQKQFDNRIFVCDTRNFGFILEHLCIKIREYVDKNPNYTFEEIDNIVNDLHNKTIGYFAVKNIKGIMNSGRIPKIIAKLLKIAKLYPIIKIDEVNKKDSIIKKWDNVYHKFLDSAKHEFKKIINNLKEICILKSNNTDNEINHFKQIISDETQYNIDKIFVREAPNIFYPIVLDGSIGIQLIFKEPKSK